MDGVFGFLELGAQLVVFDHEPGGFGLFILQSGLDAFEFLSIFDTGVGLAAHAVYMT